MEGGSPRPELEREEISKPALPLHGGRVLIAHRAAEIKKRRAAFQCKIGPCTDLVKGVLPISQLTRAHLSTCWLSFTAPLPSSLDKYPPERPHRRALLSCPAFHFRIVLRLNNSEDLTTGQCLVTGCRAESGPQCCSADVPATHVRPRYRYRSDIYSIKAQIKRDQDNACGCRGKGLRTADIGSPPHPFFYTPSLRPFKRSSSVTAALTSGELFGRPLGSLLLSSLRTPSAVPVDLRFRTRSACASMA